MRRTSASQNSTPLGVLFIYAVQKTGNKEHIIATTSLQSIYHSPKEVSLRVFYLM